MAREEPSMKPQADVDASGDLLDDWNSRSERNGAPETMSARGVSGAELESGTESDTDGDCEGGEEGKKGMSAVMKKNLILFAAILATIVAGSANNILFYKISIPFQNYPFFLVLYSSVFSVPTFWFIVALILLVPRWKHYITREMMAFALWKFAVLGLLDSIQGILGFFSDPHVPGATQQLVLQITIPITMATTVVALKTRYTIGQYIGATVIIVGIVVDVIPAFADPSSGLAPDSIWWLLVFVCSCIPFAFSYVFKEIIFTKVEMSLFYLMAMNADFQMLFNVLFSPLDAVPGLGTADSFVDVYVDLYYGCLCFFGINSQPGDDCSGSWYLLVEYAFFNVAINLCLLYLLQQDSAAFMFLAMTITVPVANLCFSSTLIMGDAATPLSWYDVFALVVIVAGLLLYRFTAKEEKKDSSGDIEEPNENTSLWGEEDSSWRTDGAIQAASDEELH